MKISKIAIRVKKPVEKISTKSKSPKKVCTAEGYRRRMLKSRSPKK